MSGIAFQYPVYDGWCRAVAVRTKQANGYHEVIATQKIEVGSKKLTVIIDDAFHVGFGCTLLPNRIAEHHGMPGKQLSEARLNALVQVHQRHRQPAIPHPIEHYPSELPRLVVAIQREQPINARQSKGKEEKAGVECVTIICLTPVLSTPPLLNQKIPGLSPSFCRFLYVRQCVSEAGGWQVTGSRVQMDFALKDWFP